ncbi:B12-binding domain-containing radical SAM protein [archaeon]|nr:MAG: B12-binding domain-containing radical SAM protein [archaeon]
MKDIVLIQPKAGSWDMAGARCPLGLLFISAIPHSKGYNIKIIDQRTNPQWEADLKKSLENNPICVGITCMTGGQIHHALAAAKIVKESGNTPIVWGGVHSTLLPEQTLENPYVDIVVMREGEITFMELLESLENGNPLDNIKGICYKKDGKTIRNPDREFIRNLDELPDLPYELINVDDYSSLNVNGKSIDFSSSRGCPFRCSFCYNNYFNKGTWRSFSAEETVRRLKNLVNKYGIKTIYFQDDNFCADVKRLKAILKGILDEKLDIKWGTLGLRVDTAKRMDDEAWELMEKSGCMNVDIGAESGNERILTMIDKKITVEDMVEVNRKLVNFPFIVKYTFIMGFPTETKEERSDTAKLAIKLTKENKKAYTPFSIYAPYPGTPMFNFAVEHGFIPPKNLEEWGNFNIDNWYLNFKSWLSPKEVRELNSISFTSLFANNNIKYKINNKLTAFLFVLYHPIAKFRFENNHHFIPVESMLYRKVSNRLERKKS